MVDIEPEFDVEKDLPEFLPSVLDRTEECIHNSETDINDLQAQSVVCLLYTSPSPRDLSTSRMPSSA